MQIHMPYGDQLLEADVPWAGSVETLDIGEAPALTDRAGGLAEALARPIGGTGPLFGKLGAGSTVLIVVSDSFRYTGMELLLPDLVGAMEERGVRREDIRFLFATGSHRPPTDAEQERILGREVYAAFRGQAFSHDPADETQLRYMGRTSRGTPVHVHRWVQESDFVLATGTVVFHYFAGYGGGRKSIMPGLAGLETIRHNHALNLDPVEDRLHPAVRIGALDGNPVAEDLLEATRLCRVSGIVNTVLNGQGAIAGIFAGELDAAHRAAARFAYTLYAAPLRAPADLVVASAGSAKNFVQSHKALFNAYQAMRPGGRLVFLAPCAEGFGGNKFQQWLGLGTREAIIGALRKNAEINGQTALSTVEKARHAVLVTELSEAQVGMLGGVKAARLQEALEQARSALAASGRVSPTLLLMPHASYTVPTPPI